MCHESVADPDICWTVHVVDHKTKPDYLILNLNILAQSSVADPHESANGHNILTAFMLSDKNSQIYINK